MKRFVYVACIAVGFGAAGCVVVIGDGDHGEADVHWDSEHDESHRAREDARSEAAQVVLDDVRRRFDEDELLSNESLLIAAREGVVTLSGEVQSAGVLDRAIEVAARGEGVTSVVSRVVVVVEN